MPAVELAADLATGLDTVRFARLAGIDPDPWQAQFLRSTSDRVLLNCSRQTGKSTTTAIVAVHMALYDPGALVLLLSPSERQSKELFRKVVGFNKALGRPVAANAETTLWLELENGSRIVALPGKEGTVRGFSGVRLLLVDEASRVPDDLYRAIRPMLAVAAGRLIAMSTPFGTRGWWYEAWENGGDTWERFRVPATECPRISPAFLAEERREMGEWWFEQEYMCRFLDAQSQAFRREDVERAFDQEVETWAL